MVDNSKPDSAAIGLAKSKGLTEFVDDLVIRGDRKWEGDLDDMAAGARDVRVDGLLDGAVGVVEHDDRVSLREGSLGEGPRDLLENYGCSSGRVVNKRNLVDVLGVNEVLNDEPRSEERGLKDVEIEVIWLADKEKLPLSLGGKDGGGAAAEAAVVDAGHGWVMVGELRAYLGGSDGKKRGLRFLGRGAVGVPTVLGVIARNRIHCRFMTRDVGIRVSELIWATVGFFLVVAPG